MRVTRVAVTAVVAITTTATLATALPAYARPSAAPARAAAVAAPPPVPGVSEQRAGLRFGPGYATTGPGAWVSTTARGMTRDRTAVTVRGSGTPLWADWDGDGVATPGRYARGVWTATNARVGTVTPHGQVSFGGVARDVPVVGDIDGDGRVDRGIVRGSRWSWQLGDGSQRWQTFGRKGDDRLVGDWNGDGVSDVGIVRGNRWQLLLPAGALLPAKLPASVRITALVKPQKPPKKQKRKLKAQGLWPPPLVSGRGAQARLLADSVLKFRFGVRSDTPIVGDWNGDGAWTPAVVRSRASWITVSRWKKLAAPKSRTLAVPAGAVPVAVPTPSNAAPGRCPTARPKAVRAGAKVVARFQPPVPLRRYNPFGDWVKVGDALRDEAGYLVSSDLSRRLAGASGDGYADILSTSPVTEYAVRRTANAAFTATLAVVTGAYGAQSQGASAATARAYSDWLVRSIACQYRSVSPGGWGRTWQSSLWAGVAGVAAWYSWDRLTAEQRGYVALMVTGEADAVAERRIEYWKDRNGDYTGDPGNTKAEEMSWDTFAPALAAAMFPTDPRATAWRTAVVQRGLASYATPADLTGTERVNGITLSSFLRGTNAKNDGTVVNHAVLNPDYMAAVGQLWAAGTMLRAGGSAVPKALLHNGALVYQSLATVRFPADTYPEAPEPRGPIYQPDGSIYFPGTVSWGRDRRGLWASLDGAAHVWGVGSQPDGLDAAQWLSHHIAGQRALQARFTDGHTYGDPSEDVYVGGREEYNGQQLALAYWTRAIVGSTTLRYDTGSYSATEPTEP